METLDKSGFFAYDELETNPGEAKGGWALNKADLIEKVAADCDLSKAQAGRAIESFLEGVATSLRRGSKVSLVGFGTFSVSQRRARTGRNPRTGESITIQARRVPRFKAGKELNEAVQ